MGWKKYATRDSINELTRSEQRGGKKEGEKEKNIFNFRNIKPRMSSI